MKRLLVLAAAGLLGSSAVALAQGGGQQGGNAPAKAPQTLETEIVGREGKRIGTLSLRGGENGVVGRITIEAGGLTPGWHGIHLHRVGDCSDHPGFQKSGGHVNPEDDVKHGFLNPEGPEAGDLPNIFAAQDGSVNAEFASSLVVLDGTEGDALRDKDGSALVIHANPDDHMSQPIGGAGDRIACAVIK